jgi:L-amino acid N-acyltransferase YncA
MDLPLSIEPLTRDYWEAIRAIYLQGIATGNATFETSAPECEAWDAGHLASCRIVAKLGDEIVGWAALSAVSKRAVYRGVAEVSVYVGEDARGKGIGTALLAELVAESEAAGIWTLQAGIFPENEASIRMHKNAGFRVVGTRGRIGQMDERWRDTVLMERRSASVGR